MTTDQNSKHLKDSDVPAVSIIMPTYNQAMYLTEAVDSLVNQTLEDWELLLVDDGSTDDTRTVLETFADEPRVRIFRQPNSGQVAATTEFISKTIRSTENTS